MIKVGIVGAAGYSGVELIKLLLNHPEVEITKLFGNSTVGNSIEEIHPSLKGMISLKVEQFNPKELEDIDLLFVAMPSGQSMQVIKDAINEGVRVIDIGGDFRLSDPAVYSKYYKHEHTAVELLGKSAYGLSEWNEAEITKVKLVANPGCYPTSILLALLPLLKENLIESKNIAITSYSGTSGAGKSVAANMIFSEVNESVRAYKVGDHQHIPEIKQYLEKFSGVSTSFSFIPHLLPTTRGIYTTIHATLNENVSENKINSALKNNYSSAPFIRFIGTEIPEMKNVINTNFCDIGYKINEERTIVLFSTIDNLVKGAAGQAIQNMNIMFGFKQTEGLLPCNWSKSQKIWDKKQSLQIK
ncbi:MAG: N-acetyl-gamma-glutamyl-phosphate reductase [Ignavibacteriales bacterium]|nr:N-acetyl-gamma-glutamyl-phosphate reductase [Ignavibacteriales bacterium]